MKKMAVVTASLVAAFGLMGLGAASYTSQTTANAATTSTSPTISVNTIYNNSTKVTGKATKVLPLLSAMLRTRPLLRVLPHLQLVLTALSYHQLKRRVLSSTYTPTTTRLVVTSTGSWRLRLLQRSPAQRHPLLQVRPLAPAHQAQASQRAQLLASRSLPLQVLGRAPLTRVGLFNTPSAKRPV